MLIDYNGRPALIGPAEANLPPAGAKMTHFKGAILSDAVNIHSHAFPFLLRGKVDPARGPSPMSRSEAVK